MSAETTDESYSPPTPGPQHHMMQPFVGQFKAEVRIWMGQTEPMVSTGVMTNTFQVNGLYLHQDYLGDPNDGPCPSFEGKGYWGYNQVSGKFEGFWIDNASTMMQTETGDVDSSGKIWTMISRVTNPETGQPLTKRSVIRLIDNDHHSMETYMDTDDGQSFRNMEITYERI